MAPLQDLVAVPNLAQITSVEINPLNSRQYMYLQSFNYFRAVAILLVVAGHVALYLLPDWTVKTTLEKSVYTLISGGTGPFVFISGFLFHHVFYSRFEYKGFMEKKFKNVLVPYLLLSSVAIAYRLFAPGVEAWPPEFFLNKPGIYYQYVRPTLLYLVTGESMYPYWYIPFIMIVFLLSPAFIVFIRLKAQMRWLLLILLLPLPLLLHRPVNNLLVWQSVAYYVPMYLFGILASLHREEIYKRFNGCDSCLGIVVLLLALAQAIFYTNYGNFEKPPFEFRGVDIQFLQKMVLCLFLMVFLHRFESKNFAALNLIASSSFAIYFLHPYVISILVRLHMHWRPYLTPWSAWAIFTLAVLALSLILAGSVKLTMRSRSRYVVGW